MNAPKLTQIERGRLVRFRGRNGWERTADVGRVWEVTRDGDLLGFVFYDLEKVTPQKGEPWQVPRWFYGVSRSGGRRLGFSRAHAVQQLVLLAGRQ